jgi:hypothetical protein
MALLDYTTYDDIRAILGVSSTELPDKVLALNTYAFQGELALTDVYSDLPTLFATVKASIAPTTTEATLENVVTLFYGYSIAKVLLVALPLFAVQSLGDGRANFTRHSDIFADVRDGVDAALTALRKRLVDLINTLLPGTVTVSATVTTHMLATGLAVDPVTGV